MKLNGIVILVLMFLLVSCGEKSSKTVDSDEKEIVMDFYNYSNEFDKEKVKECFEPKYIEQVNYDGIMKSATNDGELKKVDIIDIKKVTDNKKWVRVEKTFNDEEVSKEALCIVKKDNKWKLSAEGDDFLFDYLKEPDGLEGIWQDEDLDTIKVEKNDKNWKIIHYGYEFTIENNKMTILESNLDKPDGEIYEKSSDENSIVGKWISGEYELEIDKAGKAYLMYAKDYEKSDISYDTYRSWQVIKKNDKYYFNGFSPVFFMSDDSDWNIKYKDDHYSKDDFEEWKKQMKKEEIDSGNSLYSSNKTWSEKGKGFVPLEESDDDQFDLDYDEDEKTFSDWTKLE